MEEEKEIKQLLDNIMNNTNGIALSLLIEKDHLKEVGLLDTETDQHIETIRARCMGAYDCCQNIWKELFVNKKEEK